MRDILLFCIFFGISGLGAVPTVFAAPGPGNLDQVAIHSLYTEGEFEKAEAILIAFQKNHAAYSREHRQIKTPFPSKTVVPGITLPFFREIVTPFTAEAYPTFEDRPTPFSKIIPTGGFRFP